MVFCFSSFGTTASLARKLFGSWSPFRICRPRLFAAKIPLLLLFEGRKGKGLSGKAGFFGRIYPRNYPETSRV
jgi:hypothetical protein